VSGPRRRQSWVVGPGDRRALGDHVDPASVRDGRVFVDGRRRTDPGYCPLPGSSIELRAARSFEDPVRILAERAGLIAAYKPAAIATEPDRQGSRGSLVHEVARMIGCQPAELHAASRLDVGVSGVSLIVRKPARAPADSERRYVAIAAATPSPQRGTWTSPIEAGGRTRDASTRFAVLGRVASGAVLLALEPITGRAHQLRIHAARAGAALLGDRAHGHSARLVLAGGGVVELERIFLHALRLRVDGWEVVAPVPDRLREIWACVGGEAGDFALALETELAS
jgi:23S rRNA pseudouridine1911/1915/1917 synthase